MSELFPTFARLVRRFARRPWLPVWPLPLWVGTPWWPADTLASKQHALLLVLSVAISERLDVVPLVESLAKEHRGRYRRRLYRLARRMASGTSLPDALEQTPGALSDEQMLAIRFGIQSGTLSEVLQSLVGQRDQSLNPIGHRLRQIGFYGTFVGMIFLLVLSFIMVSIIPSWHRIMADFSLDTTAPLRLLTGISNVMAEMWPLIFLALLFCVWLIKSEFSQRFFRRRVFSRLFKPVAQLRSASLLNLLAVAQQAGRPLPGALSTLARYHYDSLIRHKLLFVRNEVEQGADLWKSLTKTRLLSSAESRALESSASTDSTVWTLQHLANWKRNRVARRFDVYVDFLLPMVIVLMASAVLLTALATLTPLYKMINALS